MENKKHRKTNQRAVIVDELSKVTSHPTADEIFQMVRRRLPRISLGTVYRNLERLADRGEILKLSSSQSQMRFDANTELHYHIRCTECGKVDDVDVSPYGNAEQKLDARTDYEVLGHSLEYYGICPDCQDPGHHNQQKGAT